MVLERLHPILVNCPNASGYQNDLSSINLCQLFYVWDRNDYLNQEPIHTQ